MFADLDQQQKHNKDLTLRQVLGNSEEKLSYIRVSEFESNLMFKL